MSSSCSSPPPLISLPPEAVCPCSINCAVNRAFSRRLFTFLYPQACSRKRAAGRIETPWAGLIPVLAMVAFGAGIMGAQTWALRLTIAALASGVACWAGILGFGAGMPASLAVGMVAIQGSTLVVLFFDPAVSAGLWHSWQGGLVRGLAVANFVFWGGRPIHRIRNSGRRMRYVLDAALVGILAGHCYRQLGILVSLPSLEGVAGFCAVAGGLAVLCYAGKPRPGRPRGWYEAGYITTI